jgi:hypothetical protein
MIRHKVTSSPEKRSADEQPGKPESDLQIVTYNFAPDQALVQAKDRRSEGGR